MTGRPRHFLLLEVLLAGLLAAGTLGLMLGNLRLSRSVHDDGVERHRAEQVLQIAALQASATPIGTPVQSIDPAYLVDLMPRGSATVDGCRRFRLGVHGIRGAAGARTTSVWRCP
jgi:hypothetical protein